MKILVVGTDFPPSRGGISTYIKELANSLHKIDQVIVLAPGTHNISSFDQKFLYRIIRTPSIPILRELSFFFCLPWLLWRFRFDAVLHTVWPTALASHFFYSILPTPYFISVHASEILDDNLTWRRRLKGCLKKWKLATLRKAKGVFPVSHYTARLLLSFGVSAEQIQVISNGVNTDYFRPSIKDRSVGEKSTLLTVARLDLHKGHDRVLEALALLKKEGVKPRYVIAGMGDEEMRLRKMVMHLGLEDQVCFAGFVPEKDLPSLYNHADIFVMASREIPRRLDLIEGFGISFLEASASGLPVVAGKSGGVPDAVKHGETGFLVNPDDPEDIARALKILLNDPILAQRLGENGRQWTESEMDWNKIAERLHHAIQQMTGA
jgi:phosphatidylinositol alpha-1,6-mannosyltransferase